MTEKKSGSVNTSERGSDPLTDEQMSKVDHLRLLYREKHGRISDIGARELLVLYNENGSDDGKTLTAMEAEKETDTADPTGQRISETSGDDTATKAE